MSQEKPMERRLLDFIDASPTPFHAVANMRSALELAGFTVLAESDSWRLIPGGKYCVTRGGSSLLAFALPDQPVARTGVRFIGSHSDSPNLRLKPRPETGSCGYRQLGVEVYGGVLLSTWLDRDLSVAGRLFLAGASEPVLVRIDRPLCRIPNLAIHLDREVNDAGLRLNPQQHMPPAIGLSPGEDSPGWLYDMLAATTGADPARIIGHDLMLFDTQPACVSGMAGEFLHAPRLDNLASCHASLEALLQAVSAGPPPAVAGMIAYDHEEVGSGSAQGAASSFFEATLERLVESTGGGREDYRRTIARSLFISADMAHAVHPNRSDRHEPGHMPRLNGGPVIKVNANQRYATDAGTASQFQRLAAQVEVPVQHFVTRSDLPCGSTIGPITATRLGMPVVDVGNPMLSMHSAREMAGSQDPQRLVRVLEHFFRSPIAMV